MGDFGILCAISTRYARYIVRVPCDNNITNTLDCVTNRIQIFVCNIYMNFNIICQLFFSPQWPKCISDRLINFNATVYSCSRVACTRRDRVRNLAEFLNRLKAGDYFWRCSHPYRSFGGSIWCATRASDTHVLGAHCKEKTLSPPKISPLYSLVDRCDVALLIIIFRLPLKKFTKCPILNGMRIWPHYID